MSSRLFSRDTGKKQALKLLSAAIVLFVASFTVISPLFRSKIVYAVEGVFKERIEEKIGDGSEKQSLPRSEPIGKPQVEVPFDLSVVEREQKSVDEGHQPWKLDPVFVAQVFVSLKLSPGGIQGEYPIKYEELKLIKSTVKDAVVEVNSRISPIKRVYLKRLIRQDNTGIWTVVGYDPAVKDN
jgi:hypothetical protein